MTSDNTTATALRPKLNFAFDDDVPETPEAVVAKVEEISEKTGFTARPARSPQKAKNIPEPKSNASAAKNRRRWTGLTRPEAFNTKLREGYHQRIIELADLASEREGRMVTLAEIIERATELLEADMKQAG